MAANVTPSKNITGLEKGIFQASRVVFYFGIAMVMVLIVLTIADISGPPDHHFFY